MYTEISKDIAVYDGWIVNKTTRLIIPKKSAYKKLTQLEQARLNSIPLQSFSNIRKDSKLIYETNCFDIFKHVVVKKYEFVKTPNQIIAKDTLKVHKNADYIGKRCFTLQCHQVKLGRRKIYLKRSSLFEMNQLEDNLKKLNKKDNNGFITTPSLVSLLFNLDEFTFSPTDIEGIRKYYSEERDRYEQLIFEIINHLYISSKDSLYKNDSIFFHSVKGRLATTSEVSKLHEYSIELGFLFYMVINNTNFSIYDDPQQSHLDELLSDGPLSTKCGIVANIIKRLLLNENNTEFWKVFFVKGIKMNAFKLDTWISFDWLPKYKSLHTFRLFLEAFNFLMISSFSYGEDVIDLYTQTAKQASSGSFIDIWVHLYDIISNNWGYLFQNEFPNLEIEMSLVISHRTISMKTLRLMNQEIDTDLNYILDTLYSFLIFGSKEDVYFDTLGNFTHSFSQDSVNVNMMKNFKREWYSKHKATWRIKEDSSNSEMVKAVKTLISQFTKLLMFKVWISCGGFSLFFAELTSLTFNSQNRNLFIDEETRQLYIKIQDKESDEDKTFFLDLQTSKFLLWSLLILRPFTIFLFQIELKDFIGSKIIDQFDNEIEVELSALDRYDVIYVTRYYNLETFPIEKLCTDIKYNGAYHFLFVNFSKGMLIDFGSFEITLELYPQDLTARSRLNYTRITQALSLLLEYGVKPYIDSKLASNLTSVNRANSDSRDIYNVKLSLYGSLDKCTNIMSRRKIISKIFQGIIEGQVI